jgi:hypothetical protein
MPYRETQKRGRGVYPQNFSRDPDRVFAGVGDRNNVLEVNLLEKVFNAVSLNNSEDFSPKYVRSSVPPPQFHTATDPDMPLSVLPTEATKFPFLFARAKPGEWLICQGHKQPIGLGLITG